MTKTYLEWKKLYVVQMPCTAHAYCNGHILPPYDAPYPWCAKQI